MIKNYAPVNFLFKKNRLFNQTTANMGHKNLSNEKNKKKIVKKEFIFSLSPSSIHFHIVAIRTFALKY